MYRVREFNTPRGIRFSPQRRWFFIWFDVCIYHAGYDINLHLEFETLEGAWSYIDSLNTKGVNKYHYREPTCDIDHPALDPGAQLVEGLEQLNDKKEMDE
jgi:hypothetical protein